MISRSVVVAAGSVFGILLVGATLWSTAAPRKRATVARTGSVQDPTGSHAGPAFESARDVTRPRVADGTPQAIADIALPIDRWWLYRAAAANECCPRAPLLVASGAADLHAAPTARDGDVLVLERGGARAAMAWSATPAFSDFEIEALGPQAPDTANAIQLAVRDAESDRRLEGVLVDDAGTVLGPVDEANGQMLLPAGFRGGVWCEGYAPETFALGTDDHATVRISLHRAVCFRGRLAPMPEDRRLRVIAHRIGTEALAPSNTTFTTELRPDGSFHFGPIPIGRYSLGLESESAWLRPPVRTAEVLTHGHDAGLFEVELFATLHIALQLATVAVPERLYLLARRADREPAPGASPITLPVASDGHAELPKTRPVPLVLECWTDDGFSGHASGVLAADHPHDRPLILALDAPGSIDVFADLVAFRVPPGSKIVARPRGAEGPIRAAPYAETRCRVAEFGTDGKAHVDAVWPGSAELTLLSPQGVVLATAATELAPGSRDTVVLRPEVPIGCLVLRAYGDQARARVACLTWEHGKTTRGALRGASSTEALLPAGSYRLRLIGREGDQPERIVLAANFEIRDGERVIVDV